MKKSLNEICNLFIENRDLLKNISKWQNPQMTALCSAAFCAEGKTVDQERFKQCRNLLREQSGLFSYFRGNLELYLISKLSMQDDPFEKFDHIKENYEILKKYFWSSEYLILIAAALSDMIPAEKTEVYADRGKNLYEMMKTEHPFLTGSEDSIFAVLLAFSPQENRTLIAETEICFQLLKNEFSNNGVQSASHVLTLLPGKADEKSEKLLSLYNALAAQGKKYGRYFELPALAALSAAITDLKQAVSDIERIDDFLSAQSGYGLFGLSSKIRLMHAVTLLSCSMLHEKSGEAAEENAAALTIISAQQATTLSIIAAQQAAACAAIAASSAAASH